MPERNFLPCHGGSGPHLRPSFAVCTRMQALAQAQGVPFRILGNSTQAQDGVAKFTGLTVEGKPGDTVTLTFRSQNGLTVTREVVLRKCYAGEFTNTAFSTKVEKSYSCWQCLSPTYSFYPTANSCSQCAALPPNSYSICNLAAVVPADGFYQSHPRSPVVSRNVHMCPKVVRLTLTQCLQTSRALSTNSSGYITPLHCFQLHQQCGSTPGPCAAANVGIAPGFLCGCDFMYCTSAWSTRLRTSTCGNLLLCCGGPQLCRC